MDIAEMASATIALHRGLDGGVLEFAALVTFTSSGTKLASPCIAFAAAAMTPLSVGEMGHLSFIFSLILPPGNAGAGFLAGFVHSYSARVRRALTFPSPRGQRFWPIA